MVRKSTKHGVHSGNTLKGSNTRYSRRYAANSGLVRLVDNTDKPVEVDDVLNELEMNSNNVMYSLNKKGRWQLPGLLKHQILNEDHGNDLYRLVLFERHKLKKRANCVGFCSSSGQVKQLLRANRKIYFNGRSLLNEKKLAKNKQVKTNENLSEIVESELQGTTDAEQLGMTSDRPASDPVPQVRYEVFYPSPSSSSITHNPKYILYQSRFMEEGLEDFSKTKPSSKVKNRRHRSKLDYDFNESLSHGGADSSWEQDMTSERDAESDIECEGTTNGLCSYEVLLESLLERAQNVKKRCRNKSIYKNSTQDKADNKRFGKGQYIFVDKDNTADTLQPTTPTSTNATDMSSRAGSVQTRMESVRVILPTEDTSVGRLQADFFADYIECECKPRKFILNLTKKVAEMVSRSKCFPGQFIRIMDKTTFLVFIYDGAYDTGLDVYKVAINMNATVESLKLYTLFDLMLCSLDDVIGHALMYLETLPLEYFGKKNLDTGITKAPVLTFESLGSCKKWSVDSSHPEDVCIASTVENPRLQDPHMPFTEDSVFSAPEFCNTCFVVVDLTDGDGAPATSLSSCSHWFCDDCWREHLQGRINDGRLTLTCPEYECDEDVDIATLISVLNVRCAQTYVNRVAENKMQQSTEKKWCPNSRCGRVITAAGSNVNEAINVSCRCGSVMCFNCLQAPHWPTSCDEYRTYALKLRANGDEDKQLLEAATEIVLRGKSCPNCRRFIEKDGGGPYMTCACGMNFCWTCFKPWRTHNYKGNENCYNTGDLRKTKSFVLQIKPKSLFADGKDRSRFYRIAAHHRWLHRPKNLYPLKMTARRIGKKLMTLNSKMGNIIGSELEHFTADVAKDLPIRSRITPFLQEMVALVAELHHMLEHTAVLLDNYGHSRPRKLVFVFERLEFWAQRVRDILHEDDFRQNLKTIIARLMRLRTFALNGIDALVSVLKQC